MEYEFRNDPISGVASARFSFEHEVIGPWLETEVGNDHEKISALFGAICDVGDGKYHDVMITGREYSVEISDDDVVVQNNSVLDTSNVPSLDELGDGFDDFALNCSSSCGLEDFRDILLAWAKFVKH